MKDILNDLNEEQRVAVTATEGPVMVIAGAGSGKTRVLTYRIAHLINKGIDPFHVLALTFTNKAAREMKDRIIKLLGSSESANVWMGTFHSVFARVLRVEGQKLGYPSNFTIYDTDDTKRVIKAIIKDLQLDDKAYQVSYVYHRISSAKTSLITPEDYIQSPEIQEQDKSANKPLLGMIYQAYRKRCFQSAAMDFDDLLLNTYKLLRDFPEALYKYQHKFEYILVDEYQDTNYLQYLIVKMLAANNENLCVVGDDAQSIYAFRGANIQNILSFRKDYPEAQVYKLEQNYRSTKLIVEAANQVIKNNKNRIFKEVWTHNDQGHKIQVFRAITDGEEGMLVAGSIFEQRMNTHSPNEAFAILYRTNAQSRSFEESLRKLNIPYRIFGGISFYQRKEIKDVLAYFRLIINNKDEDALLRIINYPARGIGKTTIEKLQVIAEETGRSLWDTLESPGRGHFNEGTFQKLSAFATMIRSFSAMLGKKDAFELARHIMHAAGIKRELEEDKTPEGVNRSENVEELLNAIKEFATAPTPGPSPLEGEELELRASLADFMKDIALLTDADVEDKTNTDKVSLMTVHQAKGLEFPFVYIVGLEENLFPSIQSLNDRSDLEEERRLFYVAITRAQQRLFLSFAENRYRWGNLTFCEPSRFLEEIPQELLEFPRKASPPRPTFHPKDNFSDIITPKAPKINIPGHYKKVIGTQSPAGSVPASQEPMVEVFPGQEVEHPQFGKGKVLAVDGQGANKKVTVFFAGIGQKQLLLKFARLKVVTHDT
ncbi:MAG: ATP-dependent DNA helicase [Bacteroidetes bacterium]|nr:ATP-dependent DNA helicase [Bacteroidota bacterium]